MCVCVIFPNRIFPPINSEAGFMFNKLHTASLTPILITASYGKVCTRGYVCVLYGSF